MQPLRLAVAPRHALFVIAWTGLAVFGIAALAERVAAAGLAHPVKLRPHHVLRRAGGARVVRLAEQYKQLAPVSAPRRSRTVPRLS
jgi:hypothetical protein